MTFRFCFALLVLGLTAPLSELRANQFGHALCAVPDRDGDGLADLAVADPFDPVDEAAGPGRVWIVSTSTGERLLELSGADAGEGFGTTLACGPDGTLFVGSARSAEEGQGRVQAFDPSGERLWSLAVLEGGLRYPRHGAIPGPSLAVVPDVNDDGRPELAIGSWRANDGAGEVVIVSGRDGKRLHALNGGVVHGFGVAVATVGDQTSDGVDDLAVASVPDPDPKVAGSSLSTFDPVTGEHRRSIGFGGASFGTLGLTLARGHGDVILVGQPFQDVRAAVTAQNPTIDGRTWARRGGLTSAATLVGLDDVDGDGVEDFLLCAPVSFPAEGGDGATAWVMSGARDEVLRALEPDPGEDSCFGVSAARLGDLDGDGVDEVAIGAATVRGWRVFPGRVKLISPVSGKVVRVLTRGDD